MPFPVLSAAFLLSRFLLLRLTQPVSMLPAIMWFIWRQIFPVHKLFLIPALNAYILQNQRILIFQRCRIHHKTFCLFFLLPPVLIPINCIRENVFIYQTIYHINLSGKSACFWTFRLHLLRDWPLLLKLHQNCELNASL